MAFSSEFLLLFVVSQSHLQIPGVRFCVALYIFPVIKRWHMMSGYVVGFLWLHTGGNLVFLSVFTNEGLLV